MFIEEREYGGDTLRESQNLVMQRIFNRSLFSGLKALWNHILPVGGRLVKIHWWLSFCEYKSESYKIHIRAEWAARNSRSDRMGAKYKSY